MANEGGFRISVRGGWFGNIADRAGGGNRDRREGGWDTGQFVVVPLGEVVIAVPL